MAAARNSDSEPKAPEVKVPRVRKVGDLDALRQVNWSAIKTAYRQMKAPGIGFDRQLRAIYGIVQASGPYLKLLEHLDLAKEVAELRQELDTLKRADGLRKVA